MWVDFPYDKDGVQFVKGNGGRWCNVRRCWYLHPGFCTQASIEAVTARYPQSGGALPPGWSAERNPAGGGRLAYKGRLKCTRPCYGCSRIRSDTAGQSAESAPRITVATRAARSPPPLFLLTLFTCIGEVEAAPVSMFTHHMRTAPWQLIAIYLVILAMAGILDLLLVRLLQKKV